MQHKFFSISGYTGQLFEDEVLGSCVVSWSGYMAFKEAKRFARDNQPKVMCNHACRFRQAVASVMSVELEKVSIFTAVGTPLDKFHSIDGWFEFDGLTVTFDVTLSTHKVRYKADVVVHLAHPEADLDYAARDIANAFKWAGKGRENHATRV